MTWIEFPSQFFQLRDRSLFMTKQGTEEKMFDSDYFSHPTF